MATYSQISIGTQGEDIKTLQQLLKNNGYDLNTDGIYNEQTQAAVQDYQQKNGQAAVSTPVATKTVENTSTRPTNTALASGFQYQDYQESDAVKQAQALLQQQLANKPGAYQSQWKPQIDAILDKIMNREKFTYDVDQDALYQQYKDMYINQGKLAMMDTIGQAAAMTGGYDNSYAQSVGQQAYQGYLRQLNDRVPELYQMALDQYNREGDALYDQYALLGSQEEQDYGRYRDEVSDYMANLDRLYNQYFNERDYDYGKWADDRDLHYNDFINDRNYQYQQDRDRIEDEQWQQQYNQAVSQWEKEFAEQQRQYEESIRQWEAEFAESQRQFDKSYALSAAKTASSGGSGVSSGGALTEYKDYPYGVVKQAQEYVGMGENADGIWGPKSAAAAQKAGYADLDAVIYAMKWGSSSGGMRSPTGGGYTGAVDIGFSAPTHNYNSVRNDIAAAKSAGRSNSEIQAMINAAYQDGYITDAQRMGLSRTYNSGR